MTKSLRPWPAVLPGGLVSAPLRVLLEKDDTLVYVARQLDVPREVVVKLMRVCEDRRLEVCRHEVRALSLLSHPSNLRLLNAGEFVEAGDEYVFLIAEHVAGQTLRSVLNGEGALDMTRAVHIVTNLLRALSEAHDHGILHCDIKPSNIMLTRFRHSPDHVTLLDYGMAYMEDPDLSAFARRHSTVVGTINYIPPEILLGERYVPSSDLYNVGLILYECLTGRPPFEESDFRTTAHHHLYTRPVSIHQFAAFPDALARLLDKALQKSPEDRFGDVDAMLSALLEVPLDINYPTDKHPSLVTRFSTSGRRHVHQRSSFKNAEPQTNKHGGELGTIWLLDDTLSMPPQLVDQLLRVPGWRARLVTADQADELCEQLALGFVEPPDMVAFGVLSAFLEDRLLASLSHRFGVGRLLVSDGLRDDALTQVVNFCGLDLHMRPPMKFSDIIEAFELMVSRRSGQALQRSGRSTSEYSDRLTQQP